MIFLCCRELQTGIQETGEAAVATGLTYLKILKTLQIQSLFYSERLAKNVHFLPFLKKNLSEKGLWFLADLSFWFVSDILLILW